MQDNKKELARKLAFNRTGRNFLPVRSGSPYPRCTLERSYRLASRRIAHRAPPRSPRNIGSRAQRHCRILLGTQASIGCRGVSPKGWGQSAAAGPLRERGVETIKLVNAKARPRVAREIPPLSPTDPLLIHQTHRRTRARKSAALRVRRKLARNPSKMAEKPGDNSPERPIQRRARSSAATPPDGWLTVRA